MKNIDKWLQVCTSEQLLERNYIIHNLLYRGKPHSGIILRYKGQVYAYLNQCVHMPRALNCERDTVFDEQKNLLRCSMHGIVYDPETGESLSTMCAGQHLQALRVSEIDGWIYVTDKHVRVNAETG